MAKKWAQALKKAFFLRKRLFNFKENFEALSGQALEELFLAAFPEAISLNINQLNKVKLVSMIPREAVYDLAAALANGWFSASAKIRPKQYCALFYWNIEKTTVFIVKSSPESLAELQQWQRKFWQLSLEKYCN